MHDEQDTAGTILTDVPARLDALPWGRFHTLVVTALGVTWILDGLEVTLAGALAGALRESPVLRLSPAEVGLSSSAYLLGAVLGALGFGWLTDRLGRRRLFFITLLLYLFASMATGLSWNFASFVCFRFLTGAGIGGEYTAINSTRRSRSSSRRACAAGRTSSSTARSGWARRSAPRARSSCSIPGSRGPTSAGASAS
jgi:MFS family permease